MSAQRRNHLPNKESLFYQNCQAMLAELLEK